MTFRLQTKNFFLTYPDADFDNANLEAFITTKLERYLPTYVVVSKEFHKYPEGHELAGQEDLDRPHHHALILLEKKADIKNARYFDFHGKHCNIQSAPKPNATLTDARNYVIKDGNFHEHGTFVDPKESRKRNSDQAFAEALDAPTKEGFLEAIRTKAPRDYVIMHDKVTAFAAKHYAPSIPDFTTGYTVDDFNLPEAVTDWYSTYFMVRGFHTGTLCRP